MQQWYYVYAGLQVDSELEIPEWAGFESVVNSHEADVHVCLENGSRNWEIPAPDTPVIRTDEFCFCVPDVASYRVRQGREIRVFPAPGAGRREVRLFLLGTAWGALCYQRDLLVLHASAVQVEDGVVAFCAQPGMGKSTLAAWLMEAGHALVSDDLACFEIPAQGKPLIYPSTPRLKLWWDALDALAWSSAGLERDHYRHDKFRLPVYENERGKPLPLQAIYLLEWGDLHVSRLTGQVALCRFVSAATYRGALLEPMGKMGVYWQQCLELARRVPVWVLQHPRDMAAMEKTIQQLHDHWKDEI